MATVQRYKRLRKYLRLRAIRGRANRAAKQKSGYKRLFKNVIESITENLEKENEIRK